MTIHSFGDSLTVGVNASPIGTNSFIHLLETALSVSITNHAISSSQAGNQGSIIEGFTPATSDSYIMLLGSNDFRKYKSDSTKREFFKKALLHNLAALSLPVKKIKNAGLTLTGTWYSQSTWNRTTQLGAKAAATVNGTSVYIGYTIQDSTTPNGTASVKIDGVQVGTINSNGVGCMTFLNVDYYPNCFRVSGLTTGDHLVEVECTSSGQYLYVDWIAGNNQDHPIIYSCSLPKMSDSRYTTDGTSLALLDSYNTDISTIQTDLINDGLDIRPVDLYSALDPLTGLDPDGVHFNNAGHAQIKDALLDALTGGGGDPELEIVTYPFAEQTLTLTLLNGVVTELNIS